MGGSWVARPIYWPSTVNRPLFFSLINSEYTPTLDKSLYETTGNTSALALLLPICVIQVGPTLYNTHH